MILPSSLTNLGDGASALPRLKLSVFHIVAMVSALKEPETYGFKRSPGE